MYRVSFSIYFPAFLCRKCADIFMFCLLLGFCLEKKMQIEGGKFVKNSIEKENEKKIAKNHLGFYGILNV